MRTLTGMLVFCALAVAEVKLGKPLTLKQPTPIAALAAKPARYVNKTVQVKGKITEVCQNMGCWMNLVDENGATVRIKVRDGEMVFPKDSMGKTAIAEGRYTRIQLTKEQAMAQRKHEAEENGKKFDPVSVTGPVDIYQINGQGAVILD